MSALADYLNDKYGMCAMGKDCVCLKPWAKWQGRACAHWHPCGATTWAELWVWMKTALHS